MIYNKTMYATLPVGVVIRRRPGVTRWAAWSWRAVAVLPGAGPAEWTMLRRDGDVVDFHAATPHLELHGAETEAYLTGLSAEIPCLYVILRPSDADADAAHPFDVVLITASPYEAQDYADSGEELVEKVPMPHGLVAWIRDFVEAHHQDEVFVKRRRDRKRVDLIEDGIGDARIPQTVDVYRSPAARRRRLS